MSTATERAPSDRAVRAARLVEHGRPLQVQTVPLEPAGPDDIVVDMAFAGVNPVDRYAATGAVAPDAPLPRTPGMEGVARVDGRWVVVHGHGLGTTRDGAWAGRAVVPRSACVEVPDGVDPQHAAAAGIAGATAYRTVTELARVTPGDRVLVLGASGGVGSMIVSLAHSVGAKVWGQTRHGGKAAGIEAHGADRAVVATPETLGDAVSELRPTVVFDPLGDQFTGACVEALEPRGRLVLFGTSAGAEGRLPLRSLYRKGLSLIGYGGLIEPEDAIRRGIQGTLDALRDGRMKVVIDAVLPLEEVNEAFRRLEHQEVAGKLVLSLGG